MANGFHNLIDVAGGRWITLRERRLTYHFSTHFHPYVPYLIPRLNESGFSALQEFDTLYVPQPNPPVGQPLQPLTVIPGSTRATLQTAVTGTRPNSGVSIPLAAGTLLTLPDGTTVTVKAGTSIGHPDGSAETLPAAVSFVLPGFLPVSFASGIQSDSTTTAIIVADLTPVTITLPSGNSAALASDGSQIELPAGTSVAIRSGYPLPVLYSGDFASRYTPDPTSNAVQQPYPVENLDFTTGGAYSIYNWELFFHAPLLIAIHLSQNQKFQDAQNWFHYIFNPTDNSPGPTPQRFWKVAPFQYTDVETIENILVNLAQGSAPNSQPQDSQLFIGTVHSINEWRKGPFQPWNVAKFRPTAYMLKTVMAYLDNLIAWGDSLFQQYTIETINEATQLYVMAANILGPKPQAVPKKGSLKALTYNDLRKANLDPFGNAMVDMEAEMPFDITPPAGQGTDLNGSQILPSIGKTLYFCVPRNDKLLGYWDTVADRLFKIHNSLNIQGVFQRLPLYEPPIDPALLVRAAAAGLDVSSVVSGINQPLPLVRFQFMIAKATEICQEVKSLGSSLLSAIEKQDSESISLLRAQHENTILGVMNMVKYAQWQEAQKSTQALRASFDTAVQRYSYYQTLLGRSSSVIANSLTSLDFLNVDTGIDGAQSPVLTQSDPDPMALDPINPDISPDSAAVTDGEVRTLSGGEEGELLLLADAQSQHETAANFERAGIVMAALPSISVNSEPMGVGISTGLGSTYVALFNFLASNHKSSADSDSYGAGKAAKLASYSRREQEWTFQSNSAKSEINQILKQLRAAQIREAIAQKEYDNHQVQMANAKQIVDFLHGNDPGRIPTTNETVPTKDTTIGFYALLKRQTKALYAKAFQLAFEVAKKAERALQNELGDPSLTFIQFNYLDGNEGLLAGEKLSVDVKTMEMAYHDLNQREYEMTKHVSLRQVDPVALLQLRATGTCSFTIPEELFDMNGPGHYFRRIKSVAVTIPCVAGPYTSVNCTLSLQKSSIRTRTDIGAKPYQRQGPDDDRFNDYYGNLQSIVTSSAQADSGLFETNLRDERYLPFEAAGVAGSQWQITLPSEVKQFDFDTITDVVLHVRYTAREGGDLLKAAAIQNLQTQISKAQTVGSVCLFSIRHEFPSEWAKFQSTSELSVALTAELYPFWSQTANLGVKALGFFAEMSAATTSVTITDKDNKQDILVPNPMLGALLAGSLHNIPLPAAISDPAFALTFDNNAMQDLWMAITWGAA